MSTSRRSLLKLIGLAPAAPLAAKIESDAKFAQLVGVQFEGAASATLYSAATDVQTRGAVIAAAQYLKATGALPEFVREQAWRNSRYVSYLDPDIASKRSWSMAVKIGEQRQRNFDRQLEMIENSSRHAQASIMFKKVTGWDWPW